MKNKGYWSKEKCQEEALKYETKKEFKKNKVGAYNSSYRNGWLDDICGHMKLASQIWSKEKCQEEALKFTSRTEFQKESKGSYLSAYRQGWLDEICSHMITKKKTNGYWTKERCREEALKFNTKKEFRDNSLGAYDKVMRMGWIDEVSGHMKPLASLKKRYVYVFEFEESNTAYIGLTWDMGIRETQHLKEENSPVYNFLQENPNSVYKLKKLGYFDVGKVSKKEEYYISLYKKNGWNILNKMKAGGLGGSKIKWTFEKCLKESIKYNTRKTFFNNSRSAYASARKNGWLDDICSHMKKVYKTYDYDSCKEEALKYDSKTEFKNNSNAIYSRAYRQGWLDEICSHMKKVYRIYDYDSCKEEALKYKNRSEFHKKKSTAYYYALKNNYLNEFFNKKKK